MLPPLIVRSMLALTEAVLCRSEPPSAIVKASVSGVVRVPSYCKPFVGRNGEIGTIHNIEVSCQGSCMISLGDSGIAIEDGSVDRGGPIKIYNILFIASILRPTRYITA
jgi:hypothetical protein